jgi:hypothetical protein
MNNPELVSTLRKCIKMNISLYSDGDGKLCQREAETPQIQKYKAIIEDITGKPYEPE